MSEHKFVPWSTNSLLCRHVTATGCFSHSICGMTEDHSDHMSARVVTKVMADLKAKREGEALMSEKAWWLPRGKTLWLLLDTANGDERSRRYCWWFNTRKAALEHRRRQHQNSENARLSMPLKVTR